MGSVLEIRQAWHRYGRTPALRGVDLAVGAGECVALLGPNGAGKTTLVGLATGLLPRQAGTVETAGGDPRRAAVRRRLGVVQQSIGFPRTLTVRELVAGAAVRADRSQGTAEETLAEVGLTELARRRAGRLSGGQRQRLQLAMALVAEPRLLVLDEPTVGLDVAARRAFWRMLATRRDRGAGVLLTTHLIEEAAAVADRVAVLDDGEVVASGRPDELADRLPDRTVIARTRTSAEIVRALDGVLAVEPVDGRLHIATARPEPVVRTLLELDDDLADLRVEGAGLEEAVLALTRPDDEQAPA